MLSGGLDSRLAVKIMQSKGYNVLGLYFKFPFSKDNEAIIRDFARKHKFELRVLDGTKGKLLQEYLKIIKKPLHGRGAGVNPCIDCRLFMLKKAKEIADSEGIDLVATGEVLGQRPMSQHKRGLDIASKKSGLGKRLIRPVMEAGAKGRSRQLQMKLAKKFKIDYPNAGGGCLLCEKNLVRRLKHLLDRGVDEKEIKLLSVGRHFVIDKKWVVIGRDKEENKIIESIGTGEVVLPEGKSIGPSAVILDKATATVKDKVNAKAKTFSVKEKVKELIKAYSKGVGVKERKKFKDFLL